ncbi:MAG: GNAT family N-acetyltransferase [Actinomycetota bacterium]
MPIVVREARPEEFAEAGDVTATAYAEFVRPEDADWRAYVEELRDVERRAGRAVVLVAIDDARTDTRERILGTLTLELSARIDEDSPPLPDDAAHIRMLGVLPEARRLGAARALMEEAERRAKAAGKQRLTLHTTERMKAAQAMYGSLGFSRAPDRVFPDGFVLLGYERSLD